MNAKPAKLEKSAKKFFQKTLFAVFALSAFQAGARAQNWDFDARTIGLGGVSGGGTLASDMIEHDVTYRSIVLPFGLLQVLPDLEIYDPDSTDFDPVRAVEHAASPIHFIVGRDSDAGDGPLASTIAAARYYADPANASGLASRVDLGGIVAPNWGGTVLVAGARDGNFHGVYIGAGPYLTARGNTAIDPRLVALLSGSNVAFPSGPLTIVTTRSEEQAALAITGGYRGRFRWPWDATAAERDGLYVAANYNYLVGLWYGNDDMAVRLGPADVVIARTSAHHGRGMAVDVAAGAVVQRWEIGFGASGIANRLNWTGVTERTIAHGSLLSGGLPGDAGVPSPRPEVDVSLPVDVRVNLAYRAHDWMAVTEIGRGIAGTVAHAGVERHVVPHLEARAGLSYSYGAWNPTGGIGIDVNPQLSIDVAAFATTANFQRTRKLALAASVRINRVPR
jgi:hypothetical protein